MDWTVTIPASLVEAIDRRIGAPEDETARDNARAAWLLEQELPNELHQELVAIKDAAAETLVTKLAALPKDTRDLVEALIGQPLPAPRATKADDADAPVDISK